MCGSSGWSARRPGTGLRRCCGCETVLNDRSASRSEEEARYTDRPGPPQGGDRALAAARWRWIGRLLNEAPAGRRLSVLEIGCGEGAFLSAARDAGCRVAGIELAAAAAERCRQQGLDVTTGSVFDTGIPSGPWDLVALWDVLDQLERPREALGLAARALASGGIVVVRGRNARLHAAIKTASLRLRRLLPALHVPDPAVVHRWGFTPAGFVALMRDAGLAWVRLHPDLPAQGDRRGVSRAPLLARALRSACLAGAMAIYAGSFERLYAFPSVLVSGRRGS